MKLARVIGNVWATRKEDVLVGIKFLVVQAEGPDGAPLDEVFVAADRVSAGVGDLVLVTTGSAARYVFGEKFPLDAVIIGVVDSVEAEVKECGIRND
jgi:ethanolamine utilization protein EutN